MAVAGRSRYSVLPREEEDEVLQEDVLPVVEEGGVLSKEDPLPRGELVVVLPGESRVLSWRVGRDRTDLDGKPWCCGLVSFIRMRDHPGADEVGSWVKK